MGISERIDYLVKELAGDNGREFAKRTGMPESSVSKIRNGRRQAGHMTTDKILSAYPEVRREWLINGSGSPFNENRRPTNADILRRVESLEKDMEKLKSMMEKFA